MLRCCWRSSYRSTEHTYSTSTLAPYVQHFYTGLRHRFGTETAALHIINFNLAWCADGGMGADDPRALQANGANTTVHLNRSNSVALVLDVKRWRWMLMPNNGSSKVGEVDIAVDSKRFAIVLILVPTAAEDLAV